MASCLACCSRLRPSSLSINSSGKLYSLNVLQGLNNRSYRERMRSVYCQAIREAEGVRIAHDLQLSSASVRDRMKIGGQITRLKQVTKPYVLRERAAKTLNESRKWKYQCSACNWKTIPTLCLYWRSDKSKQHHLRLFLGYQIVAFTFFYL